MTLPSIDETHDISRTSWVTSANGHADFPLQNLPLGMFVRGTSTPRAGVAIGDSVIDLVALSQTGLLDPAVMFAGASDANALLGAGWQQRAALRRRLCELLDAAGAASDTARKRASEFLHDAYECRMQLPARIGSYSDFNAGIHHSARGGIRRGRSMDDALLPNYRHVPIGYHGRASSICVSGTPVRRPNGQFRVPGNDAPVFGPSRKMDFELELGIWIGRGSELGEAVSIEDAADHIAGYALLNDWSARDIQSWEAERLGPFLGKSFGTTISPWVITPEAMAPFRRPAFERPSRDPQPLPYLFDEEDQRQGGLELDLEVWLKPAGAREAVRISHSHARHLYWTPAQIVAHQASNGCNLSAGDLLGTGTITGPEPDNFGTMLDAIGPDRASLRVGEAERTFLEDGDEMTLTAYARREGFATIGFGACTGAIVPAQATKYRTS
ncbi:MAG: fumarylacetoacetase [Ramlibacter sp.]